MKRRREDAVLPSATDRLPGTAAPPDVPRAALGWLRELVRSDYTSPPDFSRRSAPAPDADAGEAQDPAKIAWKREWMRRWKQIQLPDQMAGFCEKLARASTPTEVYTALTESAVGIVGAYTCLLFPSEEEAVPLRALPNPRLRGDATRLSLLPSHSLSRPGLLAANAQREGPFAGLQPLFVEEGAASLAYSPFGQGGLLVLVERRRGRKFVPEDWYVLRALAAEAEAALERIRLRTQIERLQGADPLTGLASRPQMAGVIEHAWAAAEQGYPLTVLLVKTGGLAALAERFGPGVAEQLTCALSAILREEAQGLGPVVRFADNRFLLVLPHATAAEVERVLTRVRERLGPRSELRAGVARLQPWMGSAEALVRAAERALAPL